MEKKSNKGLFVVVGILTALVLLLLVLSAILLFGESGKKRGENGNAGPFVVDDSSEDISSEDTKAVSQQEKEIVVDGFQFQIPSDYGYLYGDGVGPVIYLPGVFQMKLAVQDISYEECMKNPDTLTEKTVAAGGKITQKVKEAELEEKKYAYFHMELKDESNFVVCTKASNTDKRICGQMVIQEKGLSDKELLRIFADVTSSAQETDEPDSTKEDIMELRAVENEKPGKAKESSKMRLDEETVTFSVPDSFYSSAQYVKEEFVSEDLAVYVDCFLRPTEPGTIFEDAQTCVKADKEFLIGSVSDEAKIQTLDINGTLFYYIAVHYEYDGGDYQYIYAACDVGKDAIYKVEASAIDKDVELTIDTIREFLVTK